MNNLNPLYEFTGNPFPGLDLSLEKLPDQNLPDPNLFSVPDNQNTVQYGPLAANAPVIKNSNPAVLPLPSSTNNVASTIKPVSTNTVPVIQQPATNVVATIKPPVNPATTNTLPVVATNNVSTTQQPATNSIPASTQALLNTPSKDLPSWHSARTRHKGMLRTPPSQQNSNGQQNNSNGQQNNSNNGMSTMGMIGSIYGGMAAAGLASKIGKDMLLTNRIMERYPEPKDLANSLQHMDSDYAHTVAAKLYQVRNRKEYKKMIRKYVLKTGGLFKYAMHTALGPFSTYHNINDMRDNVVDVIGRHVR